MHAEKREKDNENSAIDKVTRIRKIDKKYVNQIVYMVYV